MSKDRYDAKDLQNLDDRRLLEKCVLDKKVLEKCNTIKNFWIGKFERKYGIKIENMKNTKYGELFPYKLYLTMLHDEDILARNILRNVSKYDDRVLMEDIAKLHKSILNIGWNFNEYTNEGIIVSKNIKTGVFKKEEIYLKLYIILNNGWPLTSPYLKVLSPKPIEDKILKRNDSKKVLDITIPMKEFEEFANVYFLKLKKPPEYNYSFHLLYPKEPVKITQKEKDLNIMSNLDDIKLFKYCRDNKRNKDIIKLCEDENVWRSRSLYSFKPEGPWKDFYLKIISYLNRGDDIGEAMILAAGEGQLNIVKYFIKEGANGLNDLNTGMFNAAYKGHLDIVKFLVEKGAKDLNYGMIEAAKRGHLNIVEFLVKGGAKDLNEAMKKAADAGHLNIVKFLVEKGADNLDEGIYNARLQNHLEVIKYLEYKKKNANIDTA